jgi:hypothetical protein
MNSTPAQPHREQLLDLEVLTRDVKLRYRDGLHPTYGKAQRYAEDMLEYGGWGEFPKALAVELTAPHRWTEEVPHPRFPDRAKVAQREYPAGTLVLVGGFTRCEAMASAKESDGKPTPFDPRVPCLIVSGTWDDARQLAWKENSRHGQGRSSEETAAVLADIHADPECAALGEREVAALAGCSRATVNRWRAKQRQDAARLSETPPPKVNPVEETPFETPLHAYQPPPEGEDAEAPAPTASAPLLRDAWGRPVPPHCAALFGCVGVLRKAARDIRSAVLSLGEEKHGTPPDPKACVSPGMSLVDVPTITVSCLTAADLIDGQGPFIVCPECDGHGDARGKCRVCRGVGVLTRPQALTLTGPLEAKATSFRGKQ